MPSSSIASPPTRSEITTPWQPIAAASSDSEDENIPDDISDSRSDENMSQPSSFTTATSDQYDDVFADADSSDGLTFDDYDLGPYQLQRTILEKHRRIAMRCRIGTSSLESLKRLEEQSRELAKNSTRGSFLSCDDPLEPLGSTESLPSPRAAKQSALNKLGRFYAPKRLKRPPRPKTILESLQRRGSGNAPLLQTKSASVERLV